MPPDPGEDSCGNWLSSSAGRRCDSFLVPSRNGATLARYVVDHSGDLLQLSAPDQEAMLRRKVRLRTAYRPGASVRSWRIADTCFMSRRQPSYMIALPTCQSETVRLRTSKPVDRVLVGEVARGSSSSAVSRNWVPAGRHSPTGVNDCGSAQQLVKGLDGASGLSVSGDYWISRMQALA